MSATNPQAPLKKVVVVKDAHLRVSSAKRNELMRQADYMETQANRLVNLARELRAMVAHMAIK